MDLIKTFGKKAESERIVDDQGTKEAVFAVPVPDARLEELHPFYEVALTNKLIDGDTSPTGPCLHSCQIVHDPEDAAGSVLLLSYRRPTIGMLLRPGFGVLSLEGSYMIIARDTNDVVLMDYVPNADGPISVGAFKVSATLRVSGTPKVKTTMFHPRVWSLRAAVSAKDYFHRLNEIYDWQGKMATANGLSTPVLTGDATTLAEVTAEAVARVQAQAVADAEMTTENTARAEMLNAPGSTVGKEVAIATRVARAGFRAIETAQAQAAPYVPAKGQQSHDKFSGICTDVRASLRENDASIIDIQAKFVDYPEIAPEYHTSTATSFSFKLKDAVLTCVLTTVAAADPSGTYLPGPTLTLVSRRDVSEQIPEPTGDLNLNSYFEWAI
jgi:hypothetical protein